MRKKFSGGNRLPIPVTLASRHFFYRTIVPILKQKSVDALVAVAKAYVLAKGMAVGEIVVIGELDQVTSDSRAAFADVLDSLQLEPKRTHDAGVLICEWAPMHVDSHHEGEAFLSVVLHTGPEPYIMQTFHTVCCSGKLLVEKSTRILRPGDAFIFDPTTPHTVTPCRPNSDQLLVLFQFVLDDSTIEMREKILTRFPPAQDDRDCDNLYDPDVFDVCLPDDVSD